MKRNYLLIAVFSCLVGYANGQSPGWQWAKAIGKSNRDYGRSIAVDASGNVYTTGTFVGTVDFNPDPSGTFNLNSPWGPQIFISKLDASGNFVWAKALGGIKNNCYSIALDTWGNVYITGYFTGTADFDPDSSGTFNITSLGIVDMFIVKLDNSGNFIWAKAIAGTGEEQGRSIAVDALGNVYTTGFFGGTVDFDPGPGTYFFTCAGMHDIFISKLDSAGSFVWANRVGGTSDDWGHSIVIDQGNGDVYSTGFFRDVVDFDPDSLATFDLTSTGSYDIFISRLDSSGNFVWAKSMGGTGQDFGYSIAFDKGETGYVYSTGVFLGTVDFDPGAGLFNLTSSGYGDIFISKLDDSGNFIWAKSMGGTSGDVGYSIAVDGTGNSDVYTTGYFQGTVDFDPDAGVFNLTSAGLSDIYVSKLDSSGKFVWAKEVGKTSNDYGESIALNDSSNVYVTGYFSSTSVTFGLIALINADTAGTHEEIFIAKLNSTITGMENVMNIDGISVFPNPCNNYIFLENVNSNSNNISVQMIDMTGKIVFDKIISNKNAFKIPVSNLESGVYLITFADDKKIVRQKIVIQH